MHPQTIDLAPGDPRKPIGESASPPHRPQRPGRRRTRTLVLLGACCVALVPWIIYLALSLPSGHTAQDWSAVWVGFDILLLFALTATALSALLRRQIVILLAGVTATLLICDAWFDVLLDWGTPAVWASLATAVLVELPLAFFLLTWARTLMRLMLKIRWRELGLSGNPPPLHRLPLLPAQTGVEGCSQAGG